MYFDASFTKKRELFAFVKLPPSVVWKENGGGAEIRMIDHALFSLTIQNPQILKTSHYIFMYRTVTLINCPNRTVHFALFEEMTTMKTNSSKIAVSN
jgi:hypothetical protein